MFIEIYDLKFNEGNFKRLQIEAKAREDYIKILSILIEALAKGYGGKNNGKP